MSAGFLKSLLKYGSQPIRRISGGKMGIYSALILFTLFSNYAFCEDYGSLYPNYDYELYCPSGCTCSSQELDCSNTQSSTIPSIPDPGIERILLKDNLLPSIDSLTASTTSLLYIDASSNSISSVDWSSFSSVTTLEEFYLQMNELFWVDISQFQSTNLRILNISGNSLLSIQLGDNAGLPIQELYIQDCGLSSFNPGASNSLCQLQILHTGGNDFGDLPSDFLSCMSDLKELKLDNLGLTALSLDTFSSTPSLQTLDLSRNSLTSLPDGIFSSLNALRYLKLSGNMWSCDCSLLSLKIFLESFTASGGVLQDDAVTLCSSNDEIAHRITDLSAYDISGCAGAGVTSQQQQKQGVQRLVRSVQSNTSPVDWAASCSKWQISQRTMSCGPTQVASCVYNYDNQSYALVQYSTEVTGVSDEADCRDQCVGVGFAYFAFESNHQQCLCGDINWSLYCSDCPFSVRPAAVTTTLCNRQYSNLQVARSVMYDLEITSPTVLEINSLIEFSVTGGAAGYDSFSWNFGDGIGISTSDVNSRNTSHRYIYPGEFEVSVYMSSSHSSSLDTLKSIQIKVVAPQDDGDIWCPTTVVSTYSHLNVFARFSTAWSQSVMWKREQVSSQSQPAVTYEYYDEECESGWTLFGDRCLRALSSTWSMASAHTECTAQGGQLMRLYMDAEVHELLTTPEFFTQQSSNVYIIGAEWSSSSKRYFWKDSSGRTQAFLNRAKLSPTSSQDCVTVDQAGLKPADCSTQYSAICEKDTSECLTSSSRETCYVNVHQQLSWDEASAWCAANYTNGRLATVASSAESNVILGMLAGSYSWIGLIADTMEGHFRWSGGDSAVNFTNWADKGSEPCVVVNSQGLWETAPCSDANEFVCEYYVGDEISVGHVIAGLPVQSQAGVTPVSVTATSSSIGLSSSSSVVVILPESWISKNGTLMGWHLQIHNSSQDQTVALHVWRPVCPTGAYLDPPGCNNASPHYTCVTTQTHLCPTSNCQDGSYYCPLTQTCLSVSDPCTCAGASQILNNIDCINNAFTSSDPVYEIVHKAVLEIPTGSTVVDHTDDFNVVEGDVLGWQAETKDVIVCEDQSTSSSQSPWRQVLLSTNQNVEFDPGRILDLHSLTLDQDVECKLSAVYTGSKKSSTPTSIAYLTQPGEYTFTVQSVDSVTPPSCVVTSQDSVEGLVWVYPTPKSITYASSGTQTVEIEVLQGQAQTVVAGLLRGSDPQITWTTNNQGSATTTTPSMSSSCPSGLSPLPDMCQQYLSSLSKPFSSHSVMFSPSTEMQSMFVNASNGISVESLEVNVNVITPVSGVTLSHEDCQGNQSPCDVTVQVGEATLFSVSALAGEITQTMFYKDGALLSVGELNVTHTFTKPATYLLEVNASNAFSYMVANLTVYARIPANFQHLTFVNVPTTIAQQDSTDIKATAEVMLRSYYTVIWSIGADSSTSVTESSTHTNLELNLYSQIFKNTGNVTVSVYLEDAFGHNASLVTVVQVYRRINEVLLTINPSVASSSESFDITINVDNSSTASQPYYGLLNFTLVCDNANFSTIIANTLVEQSVDHSISVVGIYTFTASVFGEFEPTNVLTQTADVEIQECISGLSLSYDGPKHVSNQITFTASVTKGTSVQYSLQLGDGVELPSQTSPIFQHTYSNAAVYQATLTAENGICKKRHHLTLYAYDQYLLEIIKIHTRNCLAANRSVDVVAEVAAQDPLSLDYSWTFGNGSSQAGTGEKTVTVQYLNVGDYWMTFKVTNPLNGKSVNETRHICVEEKISGLSVDYPQIVALYHQKGFAEVEFVASVDSGTNISYIWDSGAITHTNNFNTMTMNVTAIGMYTVEVKVSNDVGSIKDTLTITVIEVISGVHMSCVSCLSSMYTPTGTNTSFLATHDFGSDEQYVWTFTNLLSLSNTTMTGSSVQQVFSSEERYSIFLSVQNNVSNVNVSTEIVAQEKVDNVVIEFNSSVAEVNKNVTFYALYSGSNVTFTWDCASYKGSDTISSEITVLFTSAGYHDCRVTLSNMVSNQSEVITVPVLDEISSLSIRHSLISGSSGRDWFAINGRLYSFEPQCNTDFLVSFEWAVTMANLVQDSGNGESFNYTFSSPGLYTVHLKAQNNITTVEEAVTVAVHNEITQVSLTSNATSPNIVVGDVLRFDASVGSGTSMVYKWYLDNSLLTGYNSDISITFTDVGTSVVACEVSNKVSSETVSTELNVYEPVSVVSINITNSPTTPAYVKLEDQVEFLSSVLQGSNLTYEWTFTSVYFARQTLYQSATVVHQFNVTGLYEVRLEVRNNVSSGEDSRLVEVQGGLTSLQLLVSNTAVSTGTSAKIRASVNLDASNVTYTWLIDGIAYLGQVASPIFTSPGVKNISLTAENQVSSITKETTVTVYDPVLHLIMDGCNPVLMAQTELEFKALTNSGTDVSFCWEISVNGVNITEEGSLFKFTFPEENSYTLYVTAKNNVSELSTVCNIEAQLPVENVSLSVVHPHPEYIFKDKDALFEVEGNNLVFATFDWVVSPALQQQVVLASEPRINVTFTALGNYTLTVTVKNDLNQETASLDFSVKQFLCDVPDITRVGSQLHTVQRSQVLELEVSIDPKGCTKYLAVHTWTVYDRQDCTGDLTSSPKVDLGDMTVTSPALIIRPNVLATGTYCVHFSTGYCYTPVSQSLHYLVTVKASPLRAVIKGGTVRTVVAGETLCLDGQLSYDPDNTSSATLTYQWICTEMTASGGCFQTAFSKVFCYSGFQEKRYNISLVVSAPGRTSDVTMQMIDVLNVTDFVPTASIVCQSCSTLANYRISSSQHIALSASCENCQCEPEYSWMVYAGSSTQPLSVNRNDTTTGLNGENLVMNKWGAVQDGMDYTFMVYVRCPSASPNAGTASLTLSTNMPPSGGVCTFSPTQITPLQDQVFVSCVNWFDSDDPDTLINYQILVDAPSSSDSADTQTYVLYYGTDASQAVYLGTFSGDSVVMRVLVADEFGASVLGGQSTIDFLPTPVATNTNASSTTTTTDYLMNQTDTVLSALIKQASPTPLMQYAIAMGQMLNSEAQQEHVVHEAGSGTDEEQARATIRDAITICLTTSVPVSTLGDVRQMAYALRVLTEESTEYLTEGSQTLIVQTVEKMASILQQQNNIGMDRNDIPTQDLVIVIGNILSATNARIYRLQEVWQSGRNISLDTFTNDFRSLRPEISEAVDHLDFLSVGLGDAHRQSVASVAVPLLESVLVSALKAVMVDEDHIQVTLDGLKVNAGRNYVENIELESLSSESQLSFPASILADVTDAKDEVFQVMMSHKYNPYTYGHSSSPQLTMPVQTLAFFDTNGTAIRIHDLQEHSRPTMYMMDQDHNITTPITTGLLNESDAYDPVISDGSQKSTTIGTRAVKIWQVPDAASHVTEGGALHIQMRIVFLPNSTHTGTTSSPIGSSVIVWLGVGFSPSASSHDHALSITPQDMEDGGDHRKYTMAIRGLKTTDRIYMRAQNEDNYHSVNLSIASYYSSCLFFDESSQLWASDGCQSMDESTWSVTVCQCNHLTSFGGSSLVSISDIDFADLERLDLTTNPVVFVACACIFVVYVLVAIICRYLDNLDLQRISRIPLCGRDGAYKYEIAIVTGQKFNSGTTSHVGIKLYGETNKGDARHLTKPGAFQRNCRDTFMIAHDLDLGNINKVLIWHDNTGLHPSWYLSRIEVKDIETGSVYVFLVHSWLSLDMRDGVIQKTIKVADEDELERSKLTFSSIFSRKLGDEHSWVSVSHRPDHSRFLRVQRATCCLTAVYLYMCINAIWYGALKDQRDADQPLSWRSSFGWEEVIVAMASAVIVLPILVAVSTLFKKTRCKESMFQEVLRPSTAQTIEIEAMCDMSRDGTSYRTMTPIDDWIPAIDRESTTDSMAAPSGLKRTAPLHGLQRKGRLHPPGKRELWNKDNIMQSWPHKMPTWIKEVKADFKGQGSGASHSKDIEMEDFDEKLDAISAQISQDEEKQRKRKISQESRRKSSSTTGDLFDSDDEWVNEGLEHIGKEPKKQQQHQQQQFSKTTPFNPRSEPQLCPSLDRKHSRISTTSSMNTSLAVSECGAAASGTANGGASGGGGGGVPRPVSHTSSHHGVLWRDDTRPSIASATSKPRSAAMFSRGRLGSTATNTAAHQSHQSHQETFSFPPWCLYVGYTVCATLCVLSVIMVLLYGYQFGSAVAAKWLLALFVSLIVSFFLLEPLKVLVLALLVAWVTKDVRDEDHDVIDVEPKFESTEQIKDVKFKPLGGFALLQAKEEGKKKQVLYTMLRELVVFSLMVAVFMAGVYVNFYSTSIYYANENIRNKFYQSSSDGLSFDRLKSIPEYWNISHEVLSRSVHLEEVEGSESFGVLMGAAWLRQIRSQEVSCLVDSNLAWPSDQRLSSGRCVEQEVSNPQTSSYAAGWATPSGTLPTNYTFSSGDQLDLFSKFGQWLLYPGGGYVYPLGQTYNRTTDMLHSLEADEWIDLKTRAVFLEFSLYQPSYDLTSCVTLLAEFPASGGVLTSMSITTEKVLRFVSGSVDALMVCQIMFFPFAIYLLVNLILSLREKGILFFAQIWCWIDAAVCVLAWTCLGLYITCVVMATDAVDDFLSDMSSPARLFLVVRLHSTLRYVQACVLFLFLLKVVKQIRFSKPLYKFHMAFSMAATPLLGVFLIFVTLLLAHAQLAHLLYGSEVHGYQGFHNTVTSLFGVICGTTDFWPLFESQRILTHFLFLSFGVFVYGLAVALTLAVLTSSYKWSRSQMCYKTTLEARDYEMIDFMIKRFKVIAGIEKPKPAFRHVKFEGLPSLPSRGTSSNLSSRQSLADEQQQQQQQQQQRPLSKTSRVSRISSSSASSNQSSTTAAANATQKNNNKTSQSQSHSKDKDMIIDGEHLDYLMARLLPTWDQVSQSFQKVEDLEKQEEEMIRGLQDVVKCWKSQNSKNNYKDSALQLKSPAPIMGKPPLDPKAKFLRVHEGGGNKGRKPTVLAGRPSMTPPSTFTADGSIDSQSRRPFSDQGVRRPPPTTATEDPGISVIHLSHSTGIGGGSGEGGGHDVTSRGFSRTTPRGTKGKVDIKVQPMGGGAGKSDKLKKKKQAWESGV